MTDKSAHSQTYSQKSKSFATDKSKMAPTTNKNLFGKSFGNQKNSNMYNYFLDRVNMNKDAAQIKKIQAMYGSKI